MPNLTATSASVDQAVLTPPQEQRPEELEGPTPDFSLFNTRSLFRA